MSELINARNSERDFSRQLLSTTSVLAVLAIVCGSVETKAAEDQDSDHPTVWLELGGELQHVGGQGENFAVGFQARNPNSPVLQGTTPLQAQNPPPFEFAEEGKISIQPTNSDWVFSVGAKIGRSSSFKHVDHQTTGTYRKYLNGVPGTPYTAADFADTQVHRKETHSILDFSVGRDVGLGMFGKGNTSVLSFGVRFAQFASKATFDVRARPDLAVTYTSFTNYGNLFKFPHPHFHTYHATGEASRSFHGIGPTLSWNNSMPFLGNSQDGEVSFDWGANAAVLFGKQKARVQHLESAHSKSGIGGKYVTVYQHPTAGHSGVRSVTVPNLGGFVGASYRIENFKVSAGYRADFFFGAVDGGIDTRKSETLGLYGPFASISIGLP